MAFYSQRPDEKPAEPEQIDRLLLLYGLYKRKVLPDMDKGPRWYLYHRGSRKRAQHTNGKPFGSCYFKREIEFYIEWFKDLV